MILLKTDGRVRAVAVAALAIAASTGILLLARWPVLRPLDRILLGTTGTILALWAIDALQRRYELRASEIRVRYFFVLWSVYRLPAELRMRTDRRRRLVLSGERGKPLVLPRIYNRMGELEKRYWHMREFVEPASTTPPSPPAP